MTSWSQERCSLGVLGQVQTSWKLMLTILSAGIEAMIAEDCWYYVWIKLEMRISVCPEGISWNFLNPFWYSTLPSSPSPLTLRTKSGTWAVRFHVYHSGREICVKRIRLCGHHPARFTIWMCIQKIGCLWFIDVLQKLSETSKADQTASTWSNYSSWNLNGFLWYSWHTVTFSRVCLWFLF